MRLVHYTRSPLVIKLYPFHSSMSYVFIDSIDRHLIPPTKLLPVTRK